ncbi:hypothetical protein GCM10016234_08910 [Tianweitania populi]|uniref:Uncharacterized protein n=1 Tax=Tianweitania populi TaxID=1607949 RepID=A0A8J3DTJ6_9HYPH|nr:hypothetical protein GCM10016234_08910 [Tianweitania populi]
MAVVRMSLFMRRNVAAVAATSSEVWREGSHTFERLMRFGRKLDGDPVARSDLSAGKDDSHDAGQSCKTAILVPLENRGSEATPKLLDLRARIAQAGNRDFRTAFEDQPRIGRQNQQIDADCRDVLAQLSGGDYVALRTKQVEQLGMDQMDLPQVRLSGIVGYA